MAMRAAKRQRRWLIEHREQMRIMDDLIRDHGLEGECEERMIDATGNNAFWLGHMPEMDDEEDGEEEEEPDPAVVAAAAAADQQALVAAIGGAVEHSARTLEIERLRMRLEDVR